MDKSTKKPLCKSVFKCNDTHKDISTSITSKWIELINHIEKNRTISLKK